MAAVTLVIVRLDIGSVGVVGAIDDIVEADDAFREAVVTKFVDYSVSTSVEVLNRTTSP